MPATANELERPRIICLDGRIVVDGWPLSAEGRQQYELIHASYDLDCWICGRVTMEPFSKRVRSEAEIEVQAGKTGRDCCG